ncbi:MAG: PEP-CTERM/exosortase system-associated acyltransferase [Umezawaea sp.]
MPRPPSDRATTPASRDLARAFDGEFEVVVADTPELRDASFALRHEVYCREFGFEAVRADGLERDAYDERARHYLLGHKPTGAWAGSVRVVFAEDTDGEIGLPFEAAGVRLHNPAPIDLTTLPRASIGEISRLAVAAPFRRGRHEPSALLGTALIAVAATAHSGLGSAVCMMKPQLEQQLNTYGIRFTRLSGIVHHRGDRALFHVVPHITCRDVRPEFQGILTAIRSRLS